MEERTTLEVIAPTVEEALVQGLAQLGLSADAVSVEVLDAGGKGFLGLGGRQVRVRLTVNPPAELTAPEPPKAAVEPKPAAVSEEKTPAAADDRPLRRAEEVVSTILKHMNLQAQVSAEYGESDREGGSAIHIDIRGNDLNVLIGRQSETLNALQFIAALIVSKELAQWTQLVVDVEGYRTRRERQLRQMAHRMAEQAVLAGRRQVLEPMPANERRIIHLELRDNPQVETESVGEEPGRKVTIIPKQ